MPQQLNQTTRNTFNKGLLTEFSELSFPNEASVDELNCSLFKAGNRSKRLGVEYESNHQLSSETYTEGLLYGSSTWNNVGTNPDFEYVVVQAGNILRFYLKQDGPLSASEVPTSDADSSPLIIDMTPFEKSGGLGAGSSHVDTASINGRLVVVSPQIEAFYIERDNTDGSFSTTQISFKVRDFEYLAERLTLVEGEATPVDDLRDYDTRNCGWVGAKGDSALTSYVSSEGEYPPLTHPWYSGKDSSSNFSVSEWQKIYTGNTLIVNGHYVLDLFEGDRATASGIAGAPSVSISDRFNAVASFAGRVFYGGVDSKVYFSRILEDFSDVGNCYQVNDPTSEETSDLLDTDGGFISIPDARGIKRIHPFGASLLIFADNGVWRISGVDNVFRASEYSVYRITDDGLAARKSLVAGQNGVPFWWSYTGLHTIRVTENAGLVEENISRDTIQTFWNSLDGNAKASVVGEYDGLNDVVLWCHPNNDETTSFKINRILLLDVQLGAFYPWTVSDKEGSTPYIVAPAFFNGRGTSEVDFDVIDSSGNLVEDSLGNQVIATKQVGVISSSSAIQFLTRDPSGSLTFSEFTSAEFLDWEEIDYDAYAESSYNFMGDLGRRKNSPYITVFLRSTETGWVLNEDGSYSPDRESSLKVSTFWDFKKVASSSKQEAYRLKYPLVLDVDELDTFDYPQTVVATRLKTRGRGRVMRIRFQGTPGKDFNLLGWETLDGRNPSY